MSNSLGFASLYLANGSRKTRSDVLRILGQYDLRHKDLMEGRVQFDIVGKTLDDIRSTLAGPVSKYLDPEKRSCISYRSPEGFLATIVIQDGEVICS